MRFTRYSDARKNESENRFPLLAGQEFYDHKELENSTGTC